MTLETITFCEAKRYRYENVVFIEPPSWHRRTTVVHTNHHELVLDLGHISCVVYYYESLCVIRRGEFCVFVCLCVFN